MGAVQDVDHRHRVVELKKRHTRCGDERGEPRVCFGFQLSSSSGIIYL
jgi:hypothetical protein